jgi:rhodanese-related sulfurtransferase
MKSIRQQFNDKLQAQLRPIASMGDNGASLLPSITEMNCGDVRLTIDAGGILVDVRQPIDYQSGKVHLSQNIPCEHIVKESKARAWPHHLPIMLYCNDGYTAQLAKQKLEELAYHNVINLGSIKNFRRCS